MGDTLMEFHESLSITRTLGTVAGRPCSTFSEAVGWGSPVDEVSKQLVCLAHI